VKVYFYGQSFDYDFIGKSGEIPRKVTITGCEIPPCKLIKGNDVKLEVVFTSSKGTKTLKPKVTTNFAGLTIPYNLPKEQSDACEHLSDSKCPLDAKEDVTYIMTMPIKKNYPSIGIEIQLDLLADDNESQFCFKVACEVSDV
jgi:Niemann-Pick C2 protein